MADTISTKRDYRAEARPVFDDMRRILERILEDDALQMHMGIDPTREIDEVLDSPQGARAFF